MALGFEMAARAVKEGIKIRQRSWVKEYFIKWNSDIKSFLNDEGVKVKCSEIDLDYPDWEECEDSEFDKNKFENLLKKVNDLGVSIDSLPSTDLKLDVSKEVVMGWIEDFCGVKDTELKVSLESRVEQLERYTSRNGEMEQSLYKVFCRMVDHKLEKFKGETISVIMDDIKKIGYVTKSQQEGCKDIE